MAQTTKKATNATVSLSLKDQQKNLYRYGQMIESGMPLTAEQARAIGSAIKAVALGASAEDAFFTKWDGRAKDGLSDEMKRNLAIAWIAAAVDKSEFGLGLTVKEAVRRAAAHFPFKETVLRKYWNERGANRSPFFDLP